MGGVWVGGVYMTPITPVRTSDEILPVLTDFVAMFILWGMGGGP